MLLLDLVTEKRMASKLEKLIWSLLAGTALGLGTTGCYDSGDGGDMYGPPPDVSTDSDADAVDTDAPDPESDALVAYGPMPMYGPAPSP